MHFRADSDGTRADLKKAGRQENRSGGKFYIIYFRGKICFWIGFCYLTQANFKYKGSSELS